jgi:hypothetical protein
LQPLHPELALWLEARRLRAHWGERARDSGVRKGAAAVDHAWLSAEAGLLGLHVPGLLWHESGVVAIHLHALHLLLLGLLLLLNELLSLLLLAHLVDLRETWLARRSNGGEASGLMRDTCHLGLELWRWAEGTLGSLWCREWAGWRWWLQRAGAS